MVYEQTKAECDKAINDAIIKFEQRSMIKLNSRDREFFGIAFLHGVQFGALKVKKLKDDDH